MPGNDMNKFVVPFFKQGKFSAGFKGSPVVNPSVTTVIVSGSAPTQSIVSTYRFRGWNPLSLSYEVWFGTSRSTPNPSGNTLVAITLESIPTTKIVSG
jgi:hypothetical protein